MTDQKTVITNPPLIEEIRDKTFDQILREQSESRHEEIIEEKPQETEEDKKKKEDEDVRIKEEKEKSEIEQAKKHDEEIAEKAALKAAQEVLDKQFKEDVAREEKREAEEDEKKRQEELKPKFTGRDEKGNIVPLSYEELHAEDVRVAKEEAKREVFAELEARDQAKQAELTKQNQTIEQQKLQQKAIEDQLQVELDNDLKDLYSANKMPKIADPKDENDPGNREFKNLFETAQRVNGERIGKGLPPIRSIKLIYYEHYKPLEKPAGSDIPVLGNESPLSSEAPEDQYVPSRDRHKSMTQMVKEEAARLSKKLNIRGN